MMMLVGRNTHARIILLTLMSILLQIIWSFRMPHSPSNHKYSYCSQIHLNGDLNGHGLQMAAYDSTVVHNAPVDYSSLAVDDPLFADMPWPTESGTAESKAFANHIQWKRKLSDGESKSDFSLTLAAHSPHHDCCPQGCDGIGGRYINVSGRRLASITPLRTTSSRT